MLPMTAVGNGLSGTCSVSVETPGTPPLGSTSDTFPGVSEKSNYSAPKVPIHKYQNLPCVSYTLAVVEFPAESEADWS